MFISRTLDNYNPVVHMYMQDWLPAKDGTGTNNRIYSNLRAYLDLAYKVEVVCFGRRTDFEFEPIDEMENVQWTFIKPQVSDGLLDRISYLTNFGEERALDYRFKTRKAIRNEVATRIRQNPKALHHFEYLGTACAFIGLSQCRAIWSMHDLESKFADAHKQIRSEISNGKTYGWEARAAKYLALAEKKAAKESTLTLCIAKHERDFLKDEWDCNQAEFFPMSLPDESAPPRQTKLGGGPKFSILHLGRIDSLPSYRSLEFLFTQVFPQLPSDLSEKIELLVVGEFRDSPKALKIREMAAGFSFVTFLGFQRDLGEQYARADLQLVGSTEATGLRTRIVESFAYMVPVVSTTVGAAGVEGLVDGHNIFLADTAEEFSSILRLLIQEPGRLEPTAEHARVLYDEAYSRPAVAKRLGTLLQKYFG